MRDRLHLQRIGDDHPPHERRKNPGHRHAIPGGLNHHLVGWKQLSAKPFEPRAGHVDPTEAPQLTILPHHHLAEGPVDVDADHPSHLAPPLHCHGSGGRHDTYGFALTAQPGES
jgi:hypothetical protein